MNNTHSQYPKLHQCVLSDFDFYNINIDKQDTHYGCRIIGLSFNTPQAINPTEPIFDLHFDHKGKFHNPDGPAIILDQNTVSSIILNDPAGYTFNTVFYSEPMGSEARIIHIWFKHGKIHNETGHAYKIIYVNNSADMVGHFYLNNRRLTYWQFIRRVDPDKWKKAQLQKPIYVAGTKYSIKQTLLNGDITLTPFK